MSDAVASTWAAHLPEETSFWSHYLATGGLDWPEEFTYRVDPEAPLVEREILSRLPNRIDRPIRIIDVGAGPLTTLGKRLPNAELMLVPTDPLARAYAELTARHGIQPPIPTVYCAAEDLPYKFPVNYFDFAYARNSIDHTADALAAIKAMVAVVRRGGWVILRHRPNEGAGAAYQGLHQWNFDDAGGPVVLWNEEARYDLQRELGGTAELTSHREGEWIVCAIRKRSLSERLARFLQRATDRLAAAMRL